MSDDAVFTALGEQRFVSLSTFRRSGAEVSSPVWVARDGESLVVTTPAGSGKVKRLRHDARVRLRPCTRTGKVAEDAVAVLGRAAVQGDDATRQEATAIIKAKYRLEYRIVMAIERLTSRAQSRERVILRITPSS